ncbi:MAG: hypothetical protein R3321_13425 [Nitrososphaeraceae archaeon]|nr:hypothetical protein [Nitrososphaeraceae archaeon]
MANTKLTDIEVNILSEVYPPLSPNDFRPEVEAIYMTHDWLRNQWLIVNQGTSVKTNCLITDRNRFDQQGYDDITIERLSWFMK